jgi:hypothetical protein
MTHIRALAIGALGIALSSHAVAGQELSRYRTFELGSSVASVLATTGAPETPVRTVHQRPALMQDVEWRPSRWKSGSVDASRDPVDQMRFSFYENQLFRIVIDYGHERTKGMTDADLVDAISTMYGPPALASRQTTSRVPSRLDTESGAVIARWGDADHAIALYRTESYGDTWRLIVTKTAVETLARQADAQAAKLDAVEAPQRELERQAAERERDRAAGEKARDINKPEFRP